jgi:hypothetical protein
LKMQTVVNFGVLTIESGRVNHESVVSTLTQTPVA